MKWLHYPERHYPFEMRGNLLMSKKSFLRIALFCTGNTVRMNHHHMIHAKFLVHTRTLCVSLILSRAWIFSHSWNDQHVFESNWIRLFVIFTTSLNTMHSWIATHFSFVVILIIFFFVWIFTLWFCSFLTFFYHFYFKLITIATEISPTGATQKKPLQMIHWSKWIQNASVRETPNEQNECKWKQREKKRSNRCQNLMSLPTPCIYLSILCEAISNQSEYQNNTRKAFAFYTAQCVERSL